MSSKDQVSHSASNINLEEQPWCVRAVAAGHQSEKEKYFAKKLGRKTLGQAPNPTTETTVAGINEKETHKQ
eukprot:m.110221 g.110221  ORF g.110221 m.110221 type:complete len:71 (-) comp28022_c0_seq1:1708-1920(-)